MRRFLMLCLVTAIGMGTVGVSSDGCPMSGGSTQVTDDLRLACAAYTDGDQDIQTMLTMIDTEKDEGNTKGEQLDAAMDVCQSMDCINCWTAVIDQVYGG